MPIDHWLYQLDKWTWNTVNRCYSNIRTWARILTCYAIYRFYGTWLRHDLTLQYGFFHRFRHSVILEIVVAKVAITIFIEFFAWYFHKPIPMTLSNWGRNYNTSTNNWISVNFQFRDQSPHASRSACWHTDTRMHFYGMTFSMPFTQVSNWITRGSRRLLLFPISFRSHPKGFFIIRDKNEKENAGVRKVYQ